MVFDPNKNKIFPRVLQSCANMNVVAQHSNLILKGLVEFGVIVLRFKDLHDQIFFIWWVAKFANCKVLM